MPDDGPLGWLTRHVWAVWGATALGLAAVGLVTRNRVLLALAVGAAAGGVAALVLPGVWWLQVVAAVGVAILAFLLARPSPLQPTHDAPNHHSPLGSMVGSSGVATSEITGSTGEVEVAGQVWDARSYEPGMVVAPGQSVTVYGLDGITLIVHPRGPITRQRGGI